MAFGRWTIYLHPKHIRKLSTCDVVVLLTENIIICCWIHFPLHHLFTEILTFWHISIILPMFQILAMDVLLSTASIMNLCLISLDRYWSITKAVEYLKTRTPGRALVMIAAVWIMSALICIPPLLGWGVKRSEDALPQCAVSFSYHYFWKFNIGIFGRPHFFVCVTVNGILFLCVKELPMFTIYHMICDLANNEYQFP